MRKIILWTTTAAAAAVLGACATPAPIAVAGNSPNAVCGSTTYVDANNDGWISGNEWNMYRTSSYGYWDTNRDGRISQAEFQNCWYGNGFYRDAYYNRDQWQNYYTGFDANGDGYLTSDEYWSSAAWARADRNNNGRIDANEWQWWM